MRSSCLLITGINVEVYISTTCTSSRMNFRSCLNRRRKLDTSFSMDILVQNINALRRHIKRGSSLSCGSFSTFSSQIISSLLSRKLSRSDFETKFCCDLDVQHCHKVYNAIYYSSIQVFFTKFRWSVLACHRCSLNEWLS